MIVEEPLLRSINSLAETPGIEQLAWLIDAPIGVPILGAALLIWAWRTKSWPQLGVTIASVAIANTLAAHVLKPLIARPRPCAALEDLLTPCDCGAAFSMPSAHAANAFAIAMSLGEGWAWAGAAVVALSRVVIGVHYPSDVLAGAALGMAVAAAIKTAARMIMEKKESS